MQVRGRTLRRGMPNGGFAGRQHAEIRAYPFAPGPARRLGQQYGGRAATARRGTRGKNPSYSSAEVKDDLDFTDHLWWDKAYGGRGAGYNINAILPTQPSPLLGMQAWYDTICSIRRV